MFVAQVTKGPKATDLEELLEDLVEAVQALADRDTEAPVVNITVPPVEIPAPQVTVQAPSSAPPPLPQPSPIKSIKFDIVRDQDGRPISVIANIVA